MRRGSACWDGGLGVAFICLHIVGIPFAVSTFYPIVKLSMMNESKNKTVLFEFEAVQSGM